MCAVCCRAIQVRDVRTNTPALSLSISLTRPNTALDPSSLLTRVPHLTARMADNGTTALLGQGGSAQGSRGLGTPLQHGGIQCALLQQEGAHPGLRAARSALI